MEIVVVQPIVTECQRKPFFGKMDVRPAIYEKNGFIWPILITIQADEILGDRRLVHESIISLWNTILHLTRKYELAIPGSAQQNLK